MRWIKDIPTIPGTYLGVSFLQCDCCVDFQTTFTISAYEEKHKESGDYINDILYPQYIYLNKNKGIIYLLDTRMPESCQIDKWLSMSVFLEIPPLDNSLITD